MADRSPKMKTLNLNEQSGRLAPLLAATGLSRRKILQVLRAQAELYRQALQDGEAIRVPGVGTVMSQTVEARQRHNPATLKPVVTPRHRRLKLRASRDLKRMDPLD